MQKANPRLCLKRFLLRRSAHRMQFLQGKNVDIIVGLAGTDSLNQRLRAGHRSDAGNVILQSRAANRLLIKMRSPTQRRVYYQRDLASLYVVDDVRPSLIYLKDVFYFQADLSQTIGGSESCHYLETEPRKLASQNHCVTFIRIVHTNECG